MRAIELFSVLSAAAICLCSCGDAKSASGNNAKSAAVSAAESEAASETTVPFGGIVPKEEKFKGANGFDVDLTELSASMVYAEVYDMVYNPDDYVGKTVRARGPFSYFKDEGTGNEYFAVLISDATACCSQGIEFVLDGDYTYPKDYPAVDTEITVNGVFNYYKENGFTYCQLTNAVLEDSQLSW